MKDDHLAKHKHYDAMKEDIGKSQTLYNGMVKQCELKALQHSQVVEENILLKKWNADLKAKLQDALTNNIREIQMRKSVLLNST